jgi:hypothetical protein
MWAFLFRVEFHKLVPIDRLHHAHPGELQRTTIFGGLGNAMRGRLDLFHVVLGFRNLLR